MSISPQELDELERLKAVFDEACKRSRDNKRGSMFVLSQTLASDAHDARVAYENRLHDLAPKLIAAAREASNLGDSIWITNNTADGQPAIKLSKPFNEGNWKEYREVLR